MSGETYVSIDIETDGPIPGVNSMLQLGAAAFFADIPVIQPIATLKLNLQTLPGAVADPTTMRDFWDQHPGLYEKTRQNLVDPATGMELLRDWCKALPETNRVVFVGYPAGFDFTFVYWYLRRFGNGESPFGFQAIDIKTYAMAMMGTDFKGTVKRVFPRRWDVPTPHDHDALNDAIGQGQLFMKMLHENKGRLSSSPFKVD